ncbi:MAG TPA: hypothetical protein VLD83_14145 [Candidatus Binatia bacterium]|nr:hypothetical protein [Candidatus Binatia bacterium]
MPKKSRYSSLQRVLVRIPFIALLIVTGCQQRNETIGGVDIPIPAKMTKNQDKVFDPIPGMADGQVSYQGKVKPKEIFEFYQEVMAAKGWQPTARFAEHKNSIGYTRDNKVVLVRYNENPDGTTVLTVTVGSEGPPK